MVGAIKNKLLGKMKNRMHSRMRNRMHSKIQNWSIRRKLIFYCYLIITPILLFISTFLFLRNYRSTLEEQAEIDGKSAQSLAENINLLQKDVEDFSTYLYINQDINAILTTDQPEVLNQDSQLWRNQAPMKMLQDMVALKGYIKTVAIYPENGVNAYLKSIDSSSYLRETEQVRQTQTYRMAMEARGKVVWRLAEKDYNEIYQTSRTDKLILCREIYDSTKKKPLGYVVIGASADTFSSLCENSLRHEKEGILVLSHNGEKLIKEGEISLEILEYLTKEAFTGRGYRENNRVFSYEGYHIYCVQKDRNAAIVCKIVPKGNLLGILGSIISAPLILLMGFLIGLYPILIFVSNIISKPLKRLCEAMDQFKKGDFNQRIETVARDEVGQVSEGFNRMVEDIQYLINKNYIMALQEKESELRALQAQINPHFLFNTLDCLYWRVQECGNGEIGEDIMALSNLFRLVLGQGSAVTAVRTEKDMLETYLHIQKMRFEKRLEYCIDLEEPLLEMPIPKLILQPFVENAVVHGLEGAKGECMLTIEGRIQGKYMEFIISDTGNGMTREQVEEIFRTENTGRYASQRIGRYAIKNVKERLELKYGPENYCLEIESTLGKGTRVRILLPVEG